MKRTSIVPSFIALLVLVAWPAEAQAAKVKLKSLEVAADVKGAKPVGTSDTFKASEVKKVYAYMVVRNAGDETQLTVVWSHEDKVVFRYRVKVAAKAGQYKTWARFHIKGRTGKFSVKILDGKRELETKSFTVE